MLTIPKRNVLIGLLSLLIGMLALLASPAVRARLKALGPHRPPRLDVVDYDKRMRRLARVNAQAVAASSGTVVGISTRTASLWPVQTVYPQPGALLPFHRIVAYYGNLHSKQMGILGQYPEKEMLARLQASVRRWNAADPTTPVIPALHYVTVIAQAGPGGDGKYRLRTSESELRQILAMSEKVGGILFLDIQVGLSTVGAEVPLLDGLLKLPNVHLGLDPEFSMKDGRKPGHSIGTLDATEINWAIDHLSKIVDAHHLPPKILVIHRFVPHMVTNAKKIRPTPQVQVVIDMDGWGSAEHKQKTYWLCIYKDPVQFAGFKIFYRNDKREPGSRPMTPQEVLALTPQPSYIQYQ